MGQAYWKKSDNEEVKKDEVIRKFIILNMCFIKNKSNDSDFTPLDRHDTFKTKRVCCEGEVIEMACCGKDHDRIRHFGCCKSSKDFDAEKED